jgi:hypothetical protein
MFSCRPCPWRRWIFDYNLGRCSSHAFHPMSRIWMNRSWTFCETCYFHDAVATFITALHAASYLVRYYGWMFVGDWCLVWWVLNEFMVVFVYRGILDLFCPTGFSSIIPIKLINLISTNSLVGPPLINLIINLFHLEHTYHFRRSTLNRVVS